MPGIQFRLNGVETDVDADPDTSLLATLRGPLGLTSRGAFHISARSLPPSS